MPKPPVAITRYENPGESVRKAVELEGGLGELPQNSKVFVKPNIVLWSDAQPFPKRGTITSSRVVEAMVALPKDQGIRDIAFGEGPVLLDERDKDLVLRAFQGLGHESLKKRYGVKLVNIHRNTFQNEPRMRTSITKIELRERGDRPAVHDDQRLAAVGCHRRDAVRHARHGDTVPNTAPAGMSPEFPSTKGSY